MKVVHRGPHCDVDMFAGIVHGHSGERHPVLPADQSSDAGGFRLHRAQSTAVAMTPYQGVPYRWAPACDDDSPTFDSEAILEDFTQRHSIGYSLIADPKSEIILCCQTRI